jgi:hypothetical protein
MSHFTLYYADLVELDAERARAEIRQFVVTFAVIATSMVAAYLVRF